MSLSASEDNSPPNIPIGSPGSSVSSRLQEEYEELLKYAVVLPNYDPARVDRSLTDSHTSVPPRDASTAGPSSQHSQSSPRDHVSVSNDAELQLHPQAFENISNSNNSPTRLNASNSRRKQLANFDDDDFILERPDEDSTPRASTEYFKPRPAQDFVYTAVIDNDVARMENILDQWSHDLKINVLGEFGHAKIRILERERQDMQKEKDVYISEKNQMVREMDRVKELLCTYETSVGRKDQVISNLTSALSKQRDKFDMLKKFLEWKIQHNDIKREAFASILARRHYERSLTSKVWVGWHSIIQNNWHRRVEKACQAKAQQVCSNLSNDYETKIAKLNEALGAAHSKIDRLNVERERYEEAMKKAFMRGVCALNLEAMSMFQPEDTDQHSEVRNGQRSPCHDDMSENLDDAASVKDMTSVRSSVGPPSSLRTSLSSHTVPISAHTRTMMRPANSARSKATSSKVTAKVNTGKSHKQVNFTGQTLAPPMTSVVVERHDPITKQTIGKAVASQYPSQQTGQTFRRIAGCR